MTDSMGRTFRERHREKKFEKSQANLDEQRSELKKAMTGGNIAQLQSFTSWKSLVRDMLPQFILGFILAIGEYALVGIFYTIGSMAVFIPIIYVYSRSLRTRNGVFLMVPTSDFLDWERLFVSDEIWTLVEKKSGLTLESGKINGRITYWCVDVEYLPGSSIPWKVEIAWAHYNRAKYAMFSSVLDDSVKMLRDTLLEMAKLKKMKTIEAITEGSRQTDERVSAIVSAYRDKVSELLDKQKITEEEANVYEKNVNELLNNPEYMRALSKQAEEKRKKEEGESV